MAAVITDMVRVESAIIVEYYQGKMRVRGEFKDGQTGAKSLVVPRLKNKSLFTTLTLLAATRQPSKEPL